MNTKKKQTAAVAMATVLSVSTVVNPVTVRAQENEPAVTQGILQENGQRETGKETAPAITLPENLQAAAGTPLKEIELPENWTWADKSTVLSADTTEYPAYVTVDDETYDYAEVEGYQAEGHYVEVLLSVTVEQPEEISAPILKRPLLKSAVPTPYADSDVAINETNFPDATFREYIKTKFDKDKNGTLSVGEIANVTTIDVSNKANITSLQGIEKFSNLETLSCNNIGITSLDVSSNANLKYLYCNSNKELKTLKVKGATALESLSCNSTGITSLDVSSNTKLEILNCYKTGITSLDISGNTNLTSLLCNSNKELKTLKVKGATALKTLNCYETGITSLDVSNNANLTDLNCFSNKELKTLKVKGATALKNLSCNRTGITSLDVSGNTALTDLDCYDTGITSLDISNNSNLTTLNCRSSKELKTLKVKGAIALKTLYCYETGITSLDVGGNANLEILNCDGTGITSLDVSSNTALTDLSCINNKELKTLKVKGATALKTLYCYETGITSLDVSGNVNLTMLWCSRTGITNLDVSGNANLTMLWCSSTGITSLDVSRNTNLTDLRCYDNPLAYLNLGTNVGLVTVSMPTTTTMELDVTEDTFNITEKIVGIDQSKVSIKSGASYESATGVVSGYAAGTPIVYEYDCGTAGSTKRTLQVMVNLIGQSSITVTETLDKTYDKNPVSSTPTVKRTGSTGTVSYAWERKKNAAEWESIAAAPTDAGTYRVTATVAADGNYKEASSTPVEFTIAKAAAPEITLPDNVSGKYNKNLSSVTLPDNWTWADGTQVLTASGTEYKAYYAVDDKNYDYTGVAGYDSTGHYVECMLPVIVSAAANSWIVEPSIKNWMYGQPANKPVGDAMYGEVVFIYSDKADGTYTKDVPTDAGTWYVKAVVDGTDNYEGLESKAISFVIEPKNAETDNQIKVPEITADTKLDDLVIKDGDKVLVQGTDYDVTKIQDGNKVTVTITLKGNYTGTVTKIYTVDDKKPSGKEDTKNGSVQTGDTATIGLWAMLMAVSAGAAALLKGKKRKEETEE